MVASLRGLFAIVYSSRQYKRNMIMLEVIVARIQDDYCIYRIDQEGKNSKCKLGLSLLSCT